MQTPAITDRAADSASQEPAAARAPPGSLCHDPRRRPCWNRGQGGRARPPRTAHMHMHSGESELRARRPRPRPIAIRHACGAPHRYPRTSTTSRGGAPCPARALRLPRCLYGPFVIRITPAPATRVCVYATSQNAICMRARFRFHLVFIHSLIFHATKSWRKHQQVI